jgi:NAD(P)-dependent dehydrogenase (short-subunit alcohol dehydrogenase family)
MPGRLAEKVAIVSGAGSIGPGWGNGKAVAVQFAREGAAVLAVDINPDAAAETRDIIVGEGGRCEVAVADVTAAAQVERAVEACVAAFGGIDILYNNVGIVIGGTPVETSEADWDIGAAVNLKSIYLSCKFTIPHIQARGGGCILNVSSTAANRWMGVPYVSYASTKAAILGFSRNVAMTYAGDKIRCNSILPGIIDTPLLRQLLADVFEEHEIPDKIAYRNSQIPLGEMGDAWDIAYAATYLASDEAKYITGTELVIDGGLSTSAIAG